MTRQLVNFQSVGLRGKLYSKEHREKFKKEYSTAIIERNPKQQGKFHLCIDGMSIVEWLKKKYQELKEILRVNHIAKEKGVPQKGIRM